MTAFDITVVVGGEAGQGIQTVGQLLTETCFQSGFHVFAINDFESRIRGGHSFFKLRISNQAVHAPQSGIHLLVAMDQQTLQYHNEHLHPQGRILMAPLENGKQNPSIIPVSFSRLAKEAGGKVAANTSAAGAALALLGASCDLVEQVVVRQFGDHTPKVREMNRAAAKLGFEAVQGILPEWALQWSTTPNVKGRLMDGARSLALGALAGDCRFAAFYPMSPATGIMSRLASFADDWPLVVEQAEDEIAAVNMAIGGSFAGVRSLTATSGGGFCLMTEGLGLAAMTETPLVVINAQRPGPATGLPTRTAQGDLLFAIHASQDEFPRFVFAPGTPREAYVITARAFDLADKYQVPVIILADQFLNDSLFTVTDKFAAPAKVPLYLVTDKDMADPAEYRRYDISATGISPRALPCAGQALVQVCSDEHDEQGHMSEAADQRRTMADKRWAKWPAMVAEMARPQITHPAAGLLLAGWGSTWGAVTEAVDLLRAAGVDAAGLHFTDIWPFPAEAVQGILEKAERFFTVELNHSAQLGQLIRQQTGMTASGSILKYDGRPFFPREIVDTLMVQIK